MLQFLVVFLVILVLLMGAWLLFTRIVGRGLSRATRAGNRARQPRLGIVDIYELDRQRQLILLRRDNVEHLLLVGGPNDVVVERNVVRGAGTRMPGESLARPAGEPDPDEAGPETGRAALAAPAFEMPVVVPPPLPGGNGMAGGERPPPLDPGLFEPEASPADPDPEPRGRLGAGVGRILRRTPPPLVEPRPEPASERLRPDPEPVRPPPPVPRPAAPPVMSPGETRSIDPAILSDMARQLETAILRQSSAVTPPPVRLMPDPPAAPTPPPEPAPQAPPPPDPIAAGMAAAQALNPPPDPPPAPVPAPVPVEPPAATPVPPPADPPPRSEARGGEPGRAGSTPFTVEEIETEFARLLGRPLDRKS